MGYRSTNGRISSTTICTTSERSGEDFIELALDTSHDPPVVTVRTSRGRGRGQLTSERSVGTPLASLTDSDVVQMVVDEIRPFVER